jgi:hypothetical protein
MTKTKPIRRDWLIAHVTICFGSLIEAARLTDDDDDRARLARALDALLAVRGAEPKPSSRGRVPRQHTGVLK